MISRLSFLKKYSSSVAQLIKFGFVGISNTAVSYGVEMLCYYAFFTHTKFSAIIHILSIIHIDTDADVIKVVVTSAFAFVTSTINSYYWNNRYVFKSKYKKVKEHIKSYSKTVLCYGITGLILSPIIKIALSNLEIPYYIASIMSMLVVVPLNFVLNKMWAFKTISHAER
jgi:putative flippase GtrA